jgi:hypothetical protein
MLRARLGGSSLSPSVSLCAPVRAKTTVEAERLIRCGVQSTVTVGVILRELFDTPKRDGRSALVKQVAEHAEKILIDARCAYRGARRK